MQAILKAKESVLSGDTVGLSQSLDAMADNILLLKSTIAKMHGMKCHRSNYCLRLDLRVISQIVSERIARASCLQVIVCLWSDFE